MTSRLICFSLTAVLSVSCTGGRPSSVAPSTSPACRGGDPGCENLRLVLEGTTYSLECRPVAEALVDVVLGRAGGRSVRAIVGVSSTQGVAVSWNEPGGCGEFALALADGLSPETAGLIRAEVDRGVDRFGVTASPVPKAAPND